MVKETDRAVGGPRSYAGNEANHEIVMMKMSCARGNETLKKPSTMRRDPGGYRVPVARERLDPFAFELSGEALVAA